VTVSSTTLGDLVYLTNVSRTAVGQHSSNLKRKKWWDLRGKILPPIIGGVGQTMHKLVPLFKNVGNRTMTGTKLEWPNTLLQSVQLTDGMDCELKEP